MEATFAESTQPETTTTAPPSKKRRTAGAILYLRDARVQALVSR